MEKSTYIQTTGRNHGTICSADNFFVQPDGTYDFNPKRLGDAHNFSQKTCHRAMIRRTDIVVVDNTNTMHEEMKPYLELAERYGYEVEVIRLVCDPLTAAKRNTHGVPEKAVRRMQNRFEDYPGETIINTD